jgi:outer membrane biosynthesis protein TonB
VRAPKKQEPRDQEKAMSEKPVESLREPAEKKHRSPAKLRQTRLHWSHPTTSTAEQSSLADSEWDHTLAQRMAASRNNDWIRSRGGGAARLTATATTRGGGEDARGSWRSTSGAGSNGARSNNHIHSGGFRKAVGEVGRKPGEMEMLQSPSRGLNEDDSAK